MRRKSLTLASDVSLAVWLKDADQSPDPASGTWTTQQIVTVLFSDLHAQKVRRVREEADKVGLQNAILRGEFINRIELEQLHAGVAASIKTVIRSSNLTRQEQDDVLRSMSDIKFRLADIASRQCRGLNGEASGNGNGAGPTRKRRKRKPGRKPKQKEAEAEQPAAVQADG